MSKIETILISQISLPLSQGFADAKVATGRQTALTSVDVLAVEITAETGEIGVGFSYTLRAGGSAFYALAKEIGPMLIGKDGSDIAALWEKLAWRTNSLGAGGLAYQVIAAFDSALWDLKAKEACLPLAKLLGAFRQSSPVYNSGGQYLQASIEEMQTAAKASVSRGIGGIKMKVGQPDWRDDITRIEAVREAIGPDIALMIDANQQWSRDEAIRFCRRVDHLGLTFIEEPLDARDYQGHQILTLALDTPVASGEMLTSYHEISEMVLQKGVQVLQPDAPRIGGITPFLRVIELANTHKLGMAPHFVMEQHIHLMCVNPTEGWVEHFDWLEPLFEERFKLKDGRIWLNTDHGFGLTLSDKAREFTLNCEKLEKYE
jgi:L-alanine-DL-glutamate epimerase-like enolase superfamily enzyme